MKLSNYILFTAIAISQWLMMKLPQMPIPLFDTTTFLYGNMQMLMIIVMWQVASKLANKQQLNIQ